MQGICGMTYGLFISSVCKEENSAFILCMGSMFPQFLMGGKFFKNLKIINQYNNVVLH